MTIVVGKEKEEFHVFADLLADYSPYFDNAMRSADGEISKQKLHLKDADSTVFRDFLNWLYFGTLMEITEDAYPYSDCWNCKTSCEEGDADEKKKFWMPLTSDEERELKHILDDASFSHSEYDLYAFATTYNVPCLRQDIVNAVYTFWQEVGCAPWSGILVLAARQTPAGSPMLRLLVDAMTVKRWKMFQCPHEVRMIQKLPPYLLSNLWIKEAMVETGSRDICSYHEHDQDENTCVACQEKPTGTRRWKKS